MLVDMYCKCGSVFPLSPGETCQICGHTMEMPPEWAQRALNCTVEIVEFWYQSRVDVDSRGVGIWKQCIDEAHCLQMAGLHYNVKKIIRKKAS